MKLLAILLLGLTLTACTTRTTIVPECKEGLVYIEYKEVQQQLNLVEKQFNGILMYEDGSPVKCVKQENSNEK